MRNFRIVALNPLSVTHPALPVAAARAGALGLMNVDAESSREQTLADISRATAHVSRNIGVRIGNAPVDLVVDALSSLPHSFPDIAIVSRLFDTNTRTAGV